MDASSKEEAVYRVVAAIPEGRLVSYGQVAELAGLPGRARWVGRVLSQLPEDSQLPWQRVLRASGQLAFPAGSPRYQRQLQRLQAEGSADSNGRIRWRQCRWQP